MNRRYANAAVRAIPLAVVLIGATAQAQGVMPRGLDGLDGNRQGDLWSQGLRYREVAIFDRSQIPFGTPPWTGPGPWTLNGVRLRRDGSLQSEMDAHQKTVRVIMSTSGSTPANMSLVFEQNHGTDRAVVLGAATSGVNRAWNDSDNIPSQYQEPLLANPSWGRTPSLPFEQDLPFQPPFVVPANATNVVLDITVYGGDDPTLLFNPWTADADDQGRIHGSMRVVGAPCAPADHMERGGTSGIRLGETLETWVGVGPGGTGTGEVPQGTFVSAVIGGPLAAPVTVAGCPVHIDPFLFFGGVTDIEGRIIVNWGLVPNQPSLAGVELGVQYATFVGNGWLFSPSFQFTIADQPPPGQTPQYASVSHVDGAAWNPDAPGQTGSLAQTTVVEFY